MSARTGASIVEGIRFVHLVGSEPIELGQAEISNAGLIRRSSEFLARDREYAYLDERTGEILKKPTLTSATFILSRQETAGDKGRITFGNRSITVEKVRSVDHRQTLVRAVPEDSSMILEAAGARPCFMHSGPLSVVSKASLRVIEHYLKGTRLEGADIATLLGFSLVINIPHLEPQWEHRIRSLKLREKDPCFLRLHKPLPVSDLPMVPSEVTTALEKANFGNRFGSYAYVEGDAHSYVQLGDSVKALT